jgi:hypothetical protein
MKLRTQSRPEATQPRPIPYYQVEMVFLIHIIQGWNQILMSTDPIIVHFWPQHAKIYSST